MPSTTAEKETSGPEKEKFIEMLFRTYYSSLCNTVFRFVRDRDAAEDIVQDAFMKIWNSRDSLDLSKPAKAYIFKTAINTALNYIDKNSRKTSIDDVTIPASYNKNDVEEGLNLKEAESKIAAAIDALPPACKTIFILSRYEELSYQEIADTLEISKKTVENQMGKSLGILREHMKLYIRGWVIFIFF